MDDAQVSIRTLKPIQKDDELFISYVDTTFPYARRKFELQARWFFACKCSKCQKGPTQLEDEWAIKPADLTSKWRKLADDIIKTQGYAPDPASYVGSSEDEKRVAALQGAAFAKYEEEQGQPPEQGIAIIEEGMRLCHDSKLWPPYRQPYAALRDELILALLSRDDFKEAYAHCAKRWLYIMPSLYPQQFHPVRVVQTYQMAMIALNLGGREVKKTGTASTNNAPLLAQACFLLDDVHESSKLSHGKNSGFAKSIAELWRTIAKTSEDSWKGKADQLQRQKQMLIDMAEDVK
jgi:hypothetical protein